MKKLILIPARGGSKGIPMKNLKNFNGIPLLKYTIDYALENFPKDEICLSSDSNEIISYARSLGLDVKFKRPDEFSTDESSSRDVILHALNYYEKLGIQFNHLILLQPTTPIRNKKLLNSFEKILNKDPDLDMIVSVKESKANPYFNLFEENGNNYLIKSKSGNYTRRQDSPSVYEFTGSFYLINVKSLYSTTIGEFQKIKKILISNPIENIDLDTPFDWQVGELLVSNF